MSWALLSKTFVLVVHYGNAAHAYVNLPFSSTPDQLEISGTHHGHSDHQRHMLHYRRPCCPLFWLVYLVCDTTVTLPLDDPSCYFIHDVSPRAPAIPVCPICGAVATVGLIWLDLSSLLFQCRRSYGS
ncbi:hypothetical protein DFJ58DRAFT_242124 [Suillus subalutaceus]|uniref:uncharacterized protein n=1 Tax=Suillus subalutaceus TaxID=48586 RepID=UPI001B86F2FF|nr:uncharacterized protein DFJ58DRAFT_242124 [Suillus subalutaceus]KAG1831985.1 hypothetical protein DFJ58DRAFT_242124 [Suillus subalutaceus]